MFSPDADDTLVSLMTFSGVGIASSIRIADSYTHRFEYLSDSSMTWTDVRSGATSSYVYATGANGDGAVRDAVNSDRDNALYGVRSGAIPYIFIPFNLTLPTEEQASAPRCSVTMHDVTRLLIPVIRSITQAPTVNIDLVLASAPAVVEASFPGFKMGGISYTADSVVAELTVESLAVEPFPCHTFTPYTFPGIF